jgi:hypothetical protein
MGLGKNDASPRSCCFVIVHTHMHTHPSRCVARSIPSHTLDKMHSAAAAHTHARTHTHDAHEQGSQKLSSDLMAAAFSLT